MRSRGDISGSSFQNETGSSFCPFCAPGEYSNKAAASCFDCPEGSACVGGQQVKCSTGTLPSSDRSYCVQCKPGYSCGTTVTPCDQGLYNDGSSTTCKPCSPPGTYQDEAGKSYCKDCPAGYSCTATSLTKCGGGYFAEIGNGTCTVHKRKERGET